MTLVRTAVLIVLSLAALTPAAGQRVSDARTGVTRSAVAGAASDSGLATPNQVSAGTRHPTTQRVLAGIGMGVGVGMAALFADICFHERPCGWDFVQGGALGYWVGGIFGTAAVPAKQCLFGRRVARSFIGGLPGTAIAIAAAVAGHNSKGGGAVASTLVAGISPIVSSTIALRACD